MSLKIIKQPLLNISVSDGRRHIDRTAALGDTLYVGVTPDNTSRILMRFDLADLPFNISPLNATLNVYIQQNQIGTPADRLGLFQVFSDWNPKQLSWNKQPLIGTAPLDSTSAFQDNAFVSFDITSLLETWVTNRAANLGVMLKLLDETPGNYLAIPGKSSGDSRLWPYLELSARTQTAPENHSLIRATPLDQSAVVNTQNDPACALVTNVLLYDYSFIVVNTGGNPAIGYLQLSPDNANWHTDPGPATIDAGATVSFIPNIITKFARFCYQSKNLNQPTSLKVFLQGRTYN